MEFLLYVDGGGTPTSPCYFSYKAFMAKDSKRRMLKQLKDASVSRFWLTNIPYERIPEGCSFYNNHKQMTNNVAEYAALYYGLDQFYRLYGNVMLTVFQDSQLVVNQVNGIFTCNSEHLSHWLKAVNNLKLSLTKLEWVPRDFMVNVLGH
jgi:hypothetical protein